MLFRSGSYKTFVIKANEQKQENLTQLLALLDSHGIEYGTGLNATAKGVNYYTGKEEPFTITKEDIVVSGLQPNSALLQVLLEPKTSLSDSATYDITAWSLPYAYGLQAFASKEKYVGVDRFQKINYSVPTTSYGYAMQIGRAHV